MTFDAFPLPHSWTPRPPPPRESESDNATEGVIWKARDLWSAPVEWSNHGMQAQKSSESMQSSAATSGAHPPSGGCCAMSVRQHVVVKGCAATKPPRRLP